MDDIEEDRLLFERWQKNDSEAFSVLYNKYKGRLFGFLIKLTRDPDLAEDIMQETFFAALRNAHQYDKSRNLLSWLFGIAHKKTIDYYRHKKVEFGYTEEARGAHGSKIEKPDIDTDNRALMEIINEAVDNLEPAQREVFLMREMGGVPFKEIAEKMGCPLNTALGRMRLALLNIRKELESRGIYYGV